VFLPSDDGSSDVRRAAGERAAVRRAYEVCERITRVEARNFSYGIRLLPPPRRRRLSAVYAFARRVDDIGDGDLPATQKLALLDAAERDLARLAAVSPSPESDPVLVALQDAAVHGMALAPFAELVDGCRDDVTGRTYEDVDELYAYCRKVAGSVGRLSLTVFGTSDPERAVSRADALGIALQLTNILRDIVEDRQRGRVYLPSQDLRRFGCTLQTASDGPPAAGGRSAPGGLLVDDEERLAALVRFEAVRARDWYARGLTLLPLLDRRSRACCAAMAGIYLRLLDRIEADPGRVLRGRTSVSPRAKAAVALSALIGRCPW
jgi:phytoene synthase